jgi:hypothetical protein
VVRPDGGVRRIVADEAFSFDWSPRQVGQTRREWLEAEIAAAMNAASAQG